MSAARGRGGKMAPMSYDISLYPRRPGQEWDDVIEAAEADDEALAGDEAALAAGVETFRRIELRLREVLTGTIESWSAEETGGDVYGELSAVDTGIQVELFDRSASVSFAYWEQEDLEAFHAQVRRAVEIVADETGYEAFDAQTGETFDGTFDDETGRTLTRELGEESDHTPAADGTTAAGSSVDAGRTQAAATAPDPRRSPTNLRRRGWIYLILGVALVALAAQRLGSGGGSAITWALLVIGALDLAGGAFLLFVARQQTPVDEGPTGPAGPTDPAA